MSARGEIDIQTGPAYFPLYYYTGAPDRSSFSPVQAAYAAPQSSSTVALSLFVIRLLMSRPAVRAPYNDAVSSVLTRFPRHTLPEFSFFISPSVARVSFLLVYKLRTFFRPTLFCWEGTKRKKKKKKRKPRIGSFSVSLHSRSRTSFPRHFLRTGFPEGFVRRGL